MPEVGLKLRPGVQTEWTPTLLESGISACNLIRWESGLPQKLGGWVKYYPNALAGTPRALHAWGDLNANNYLGVGTTTALNVISGGSLSNLTPQTLTSDFAPDFTTTVTSTTVEITDPNISNVTTFDAVFFNTPISVGGIILHGIYAIDLITGATSYQITALTPATSSVTSGGDVPVFDTTSGSAVVEITLAAHGRAAGDVFTFPIPTTVGGVTISGTYRIQTVPTADTFTIGVNVQASSTATASMNGGDAELVYYINLGPPAAGVGYGLGGYGDGGYGTGDTPTAQTGTPITTTNWSLDNWGEIFLSCPKNGGVYYWQPSGGNINAFFIPTAPTFNGGIFVAMPYQILVCWGSTAAAPGSASYTASAEQRDPLMVRWSEQGDFTLFTPTSTDQAGSQRIPTGSEIRGGIQGPQQGLIWTDIDVYSMQYIGPPFVFGFNKLASGCGLIGQHAVCIMRGVVYWMSSGSFFMLGGGGVQEIPCPVWDVVFQNLDTDNADKCVAAANSQFSEIIFYYPSSGGNGECDSYVKVNITEGMAWDYGSLPRNAWIDQSVLGQAIGASSQGLIYQHEMGMDADGQAMNPWFETGWFVIAEGQQFSFIDWIFPDMKWGFYNGSQNATVLFTIYAVDYPNGTVRTYGPFTMTTATQYINCRLRGRQIKVRVESNDLGSFWRLGNIRSRIASDGRR